MDTRICWVLFVGFLSGCGGAAGTQTSAAPANMPSVVDLTAAPEVEMTPEAATDFSPFLSWDRLEKTSRGLQVPDELLPEVFRSWAAGVESCNVEEKWTRDADGNGMRRIFLSGLSIGPQLEQLLEDGAWRKVPLTKEEDEEFVIDVFKVTNGQISLIGGSGFGAAVIAPTDFPPASMWASAHGAVVADLVQKVQNALHSPPATSIWFACQPQNGCDGSYEFSLPLTEANDAEVRTWGLVAPDPPVPWAPWTKEVDGVDIGVSYTRLQADHALLGFSLHDLPDRMTDHYCD